VFAINLYFWDPPSYGGEIFYPDWAHGIGWFLMVLVASQVGLPTIRISNRDFGTTY
jgi:hypothetical protein